MSNKTISIAQENKLFDGIDVSSYQGTIDFNRVKASGIDVVYIKAGEGGQITDPYFKQNYLKAARAGLIFGAYYYVTAKNTSEAKAQANDFFNLIRATSFNARPAMDFEDLDLGPVLHLILRLIMSFFGVFGFSIMFNSPAPMAATAALIGAIANSLRLELVDLTGMPAPAAAFAGALTAGLLASFIKENNGYPRISLTVPSIVIMVPGLYLYRAIYNFGIMALSDAVSWFASAIMIIIALPLGLIFARILTDKTFRYCT